MKNNAHISALDGIKGVAIISIICYHLFPRIMSGGFLWVNAFLVLGGFYYGRKIESITLSTENGKQQIQRILNYVYRSFQRVWIPIFIFVGFLMIFLYIYHRQELSYVRHDILSSIFLVNNFNQILADQSYFARGLSQSPFTHLWYSSIYFQSLIVSTLFMIGLNRFNVNGFRKAIFWLTSTFISHIIMAVYYLIDAQSPIIYYGFFSRYASFSMGIALVYLVPIVLNWLFKSKHKTFILNVSAISSLGFMLYFTVTLQDNQSFAYILGLPAINYISALFIFALVAGTPFIYSLFNFDLFTWLGKRSYGYYLWYFPVTLYGVTLPFSTPINIIIMTLILVTVAEWQYQLVELKGVNFPEWMQFKPIQDIRHLLNTKRITFYAIVRLLFVGLFLCAFISGVVLSKHNMRFDLFKLNYSKYQNAYHMTEVPYPNTDMMRENTQFMTPYIDHRVYTPTLARIPNILDPYRRNTNQLKASILHVQAIQHHLMSESPELAELLSNEVIHFANRFNVTLFGDSVALLNSRQFSILFPESTTYGKVSLSYWNGGLDTFQSLVNENFVKEHVVVQMGTNGGLSKDEVTELINIGGSDKTYYFLSVFHGDLDDHEQNAILRSAIEEHPNAHFINWYDTAQNHPEWFGDDGTHENETGSINYVAFIANALYHLNSSN